jgi:acid phosphatase (class A)
MVVTWKFLVPAAGLLGVGLLLARPATLPGGNATPAAADTRFATLGYLAPQELPNSIALLSEPPQAGSPEMKRDIEARDAALRLRDTPRYALAIADSGREQSSTEAAFQCAFGTEISAERTPAISRLLARVRVDVRAATYPAKSHFRRDRPFVTYNTHPCNPDDEQNVRYDGSYPSARGAAGWAYALVLADLNPSRAEQILSRGREFGQSRLVCDEEWLSDVDAARAVATAVLAAIHEKPAYRADFEVAKKETAEALQSSMMPPNCRSEALALASR